MIKELMSSRIRPPGPVLGSPGDRLGVIGARANSYLIGREIVLPLLLGRRLLLAVAWRLCVAALSSPLPVLVAGPGLDTPSRTGHVWTLLRSGTSICHVGSHLLSAAS
jgi:hypothetical protein